MTAFEVARGVVRNMYGNLRGEREGETEQRTGGLGTTKEGPSLASDGSTEKRKEVGTTTVQGLVEVRDTEGQRPKEKKS